MMTHVHLQAMCARAPGSRAGLIPGGTGTGTCSATHDWLKLHAIDPAAAGSGSGTMELRGGRPRYSESVTRPRSGVDLYGVADWPAGVGMHQRPNPAAPLEMMPRRSANLPFYSLLRACMCMGMLPIPWHSACIRGQAKASNSPGYRSSRALSADRLSRQSQADRTWAGCRGSLPRTVRWSRARVLLPACVPNTTLLFSQRTFREYTHCSVCRGPEPESSQSTQYPVWLLDERSLARIRQPG
jgi:hypothetical protein